MKEFRADFDSLRAYQCPDWFRDAKFGIWSHWGPQSVPMQNDWYARNMYIQGTRQYNFHVRHYGHPSKFGYLDVCRLWKAERFDPEELMDLYVRAGARYFMAQATHHDHFFNYQSKVNRFNSVNIGPGKDICRLWKDAADNAHLPFGLSEHLAASFTWWAVNKGCDSYGPYKGIPYDGNRPELQDFYHNNKAYAEELQSRGILGEMPERWMTTDRNYQEYWLKAIREMIDLFQPDLLYSDSGLPFLQPEAELSNTQPGLEAVAHLYNTSIEKFGSNHAVYTQKDRRPQIAEVGLVDVECSQLAEISQRPWQTDTFLGGWFYDEGCSYKPVNQLIEMLVDIVSKNGCMMLNVSQRPDGTIDEEARWELEEIGKWISICGEGIYGTRPFRVFGEGDTRVTIQGFTEERALWTAKDFRFTTDKSGKILYAFMMAEPADHRAVITSLTEQEKVKSVRLLGGETLPFEQAFGVLSVKLPEKLPAAYINALAIQL